MKRGRNDQKPPGFIYSILSSVLVILNAIAIWVDEEIIDYLFAPLKYLIGMEILLNLVPICFTIALIILASGLVLRIMPGQHLRIGVLLIACSLFCLLIGGGFVFGSAFGIRAGVAASRYTGKDRGMG